MILLQKYENKFNVQEQYNKKDERDDIFLHQTTFILPESKKRFKCVRCLNTQKLQML